MHRVLPLRGVVVVSVLLVVVVIITIIIILLVVFFVTSSKRGRQVGDFPGSTSSIQGKRRPDLALRLVLME